MRVVSAKTMQELDRRTIAECGVPGLVLMENAGGGCADLIDRQYGEGTGRRAVVIAGKGNNGGDGYVIARHLREKGWQAAIFVVARREEVRGDALANLERLDGVTVTFCPERGMLGHYVTVLQDADVVVDALFGTGLASVLTGATAEAVTLVNAAGRPVVSVDIPSGIDATTGEVHGCAVRAEITVTFAFPKLGHVLYPGTDHTGRLEVVDIGIPPELASAAPTVEFLTAGDVGLLLRRRDRTAHKGMFGHALIIAGSAGKTGAAAMAANSAVRSGAGLVTLAVPASLNAILEIKTTEAMTIPLPDGGRGFLGDADQTFIDNTLAGKDAVAIGPGLATHPETVLLIEKLVGNINLPLVIDADGLNALATAPTVLDRRRSPVVILTPHPGEMARLTGLSVPQVESDRLGVAGELARRHRVHVILKGARTVIAAPDGRMAVNGSGNPGMASGGMGDVLTGALVALLAQGYEAFAACRLGVFLHGLAADLVAADKGEIGISAVDVQERLPHAFKNLIEGSERDYADCR